MAFGMSTMWRNQPHCPSRHLQRWPVPSGSQARSQTLFFSSSVCVPADCSARACCPSVTTSAGTSSGRSWIWPSAAGEHGGGGGRGVAGRRGGKRGRVGGALLKEKGQGREHVSGQRESETGWPAGREAERGPHAACEHQGLGDNEAWRRGVPVPLEIPWLRTHHSSSGLFI